ncbi:MAG: alpha/beta hydrolase, partial [Sandaracinaceae bacterium]
EEITSASGEPDAVLRFYEAFVEALLEVLSADAPDLFDRLDAIAGGSLGGNLVLRLAERQLPWVRRVVSWSPASIDYSWDRSELLDLIKSEAVRQTLDGAVRPADEDSRRDFFVGGLTSIRNQAGYWYREDWEPCAERFVDEGLLQIGETYDDRFRRWHFRVAHEQLVFSHLEDDPATGAPRFESIDVPVMLLAGEADDAVPMQTWTFARRLSPHLGGGQTLFLEDTGHAMHSERPSLLAREVADWLLH